MSSSSTPFNFLGILVDLGNKLPTLLREAKNRPVEDSADILGNVKNIVTNVLNSIKNAPRTTFFAKESLQNLGKRIEGTLEEFIKHDPERKSGYEDLRNEVGAILYRKQVSDVGSTSSLTNANSITDTSHPDEPDIDFSELGKLSSDEKQRLRCFLLFPLAAEVKKREIVHCWIGLGLDNLLVGERLLAKFVAIGVIVRPTKNKRVLSRYILPKSVRTHLDQTITSPSVRTHLDQTITSPHKEDDGSWSVLRKSRPQNEEKTFFRKVSMIHGPGLEEHKEHPEALLNIEQTILNAKRLKTLSGMKSLKVVHLGKWQQDSKTYIVVEDVEAFKHLKNLSEARFLSLEGVSGMVELPESVCELKLLKVLDLRGCNNLELLPPGIKSLVNLTHLDLSGCYLLGHVPKGIASLRNLQVLKGFIINTDDPSDLHPYNVKRKGKGNNHTTTSQPCEFGKLSVLEQLRKLTIITRRMEFPTPQDINITLSKMIHLNCLKITWVGNSLEDYDDDKDNDLGTFPDTLTKLELLAAPRHTASRLLHLISRSTRNSRLEKLYIIGGGLRVIKHVFPQPRIVRLRYLRQLRIAWENLTMSFPNLARLEAVGCANLVLFPCDEYGIWEQRSRLSSTSS